MHTSHTLLLWWLCVLVWLCRSACSFTSTAVCLYFYFSNSDSTLCSDLFSPKLSRIFCQSTVTLRVKQCVFVCVCMCVAVYTVLMLICPDDRHYQFVGFLLLCSLNSNISPSCQFPPAATGLNLRRSYQHNSLITIKLSEWRKHLHTHLHIHIWTHTNTWHILCQWWKHRLYACSQTLYRLGIHLPQTRKRKPILRKKLPPYYLLAKALANVSYT